MNDGQPAVDYYAVLKVNPDCDTRILELAYHYFAKMYHPDNLESADLEKFNEVVEAYRVLRDPERRSEYDRRYTRSFNRTAYDVPTDGDLAIDDQTAQSDAETHLKILLYLYKRRREHAGDAGVIGWYVQDMLGCSEDAFQFHIWYLKAKGFVEVTEQGTIAVTVDGVDHVIANSRTPAAETLLLRQAGFAPGGFEPH